MSTTPPQSATSPDLVPVQIEFDYDNGEVSLVLEHVASDTEIVCAGEFTITGSGVTERRNAWITSLHGADDERGIPKSVILTTARRELLGFVDRYVYENENV